MNFAVNPINANRTSLPSLFAQYKQTQASAQNIATVVYESLEHLTGAENGISLQDLKNLNQTLSNENLTQSSAYTLVNTMINRFDTLSSDGEKISQSDFLNTIKFSAAQNFSSNPEINSLLKQSGLDVSQAVSQIIGSTNAQTLALVQFMDSLTDETLGKMISNIYSSSKTSKNDKLSQSTNKSTTAQDYTTVSASPLKYPIDITV